MNKNHLNGEYSSFLTRKAILDIPTGLPCSLDQVHPKLFEFQKLIVKWAVMRGRAAIFADCGLGKTFMQLEWARLIGGKVLIVAPLCVSQQTIREAKKLGTAIAYAKTQAEATGELTITNYERIEAFDPSAFKGIVLDESSILKSFDGKIRTQLIEMFSKTPFRLACTATPAPNDISELANHAEFLGVMNRTEMLASFFVHDEQNWRLKGHATQAFWKWMASWSVCLRKPSDIGCNDKGFDLPPITFHPMRIETGFKQDGMLFGVDVVGLQGRLKARQGTVGERVKASSEMINASPERWLVWCALNSEGDALEKAIPGSVQVSGSDTIEHKEKSMIDFVEGKIRVLISKSSIFGFGMNFQSCHNMAFVGLGDSYEQYYQAIRRCWRFGQKNPVNVWIVYSDIEGPIIDNVKHKEREAEKLHDSVVAFMKNEEIKTIRNQSRERDAYTKDSRQEKEWTMNLGDTCDHTAEMPDECMDFSICSPPFAALYTYTNSDRDMGNAKNEGQFFEHYAFLLHHWLRVMKPGRLAAVHVSQIPAMLSRDGYIGMKDFRGKVINAHIEAGWIYHGEICIDKNPQAQAIRTKAKGLTFSQLEKDASWMRPALADFVLLFRKPGENQIVVKPQVNREEWIQYARPCWYDIRESDTLTVAEAREEKDERHICPLQLPLIDRCVRLWSNRGETVFSPFAGIGSEGYQSLLLERRFIGNELKKSYWQTACNNLAKAVARRSEGMLRFDSEPVTA